MRFSPERLLASLVSTAIFALTSVSAQGAVLFVSSTQDAGAGSLRASVAAAGAGDTIEFNIPTSDPGYNNSTGVFTITLTSGEIVIAKDLTIAAPSAANIAVSGNQATRIFDITAGVVAISDLSLINGKAEGAAGINQREPGMPGIGGAVLNQGTLTMTRCTFKGNTARGGMGSSILSGSGKGGDGLGGAIANQNSLSLVACTLESNTAMGGLGGAVEHFPCYCWDSSMGGMGAGGAIHNAANAILSLSNCTITANSATGRDARVLPDSSFAVYGAAAQGGGIANFGNLTIVHCTISNNVAFGGASSPGYSGPLDGAASSGGGLYSAPDSVSVIRDTILAPNGTVGGAPGAAPAGPGAANGPDVNGAVSSQGHNLLGRSDGCAGFTSDDQQGGTTDDTRLDPKLGALGNYGGPTETLPLLAGSPAIDSGDSAEPARDQRGFVRAGPPDIGAFEYQGTQPVVLANIATRLRVQPGDNAMIGGFIITGTQPKTVIIRGIGPSLPLPGALADPVIYLYDATGALITTNDNWNDAPNRQQIIDSGLAPTNELESALLETFNPGAYTVVVRGGSDATGIGLFEVYDLDRTVNSKLANISTRGLVQTANNVMIGGFIVVGPDSQKVIVRAMGPSLPLSGALANPRLELHDGNGALFAANDDWRSDQEAEINATGLAPSNNLESALVRTLPPGSYTAIVSGVNDTTGVALVEVYALN
ncbi:MAG: choice-of-anchor Q domain-containing protein [Chthoniobacterales bacterium]